MRASFTLLAGAVATVASLCFAPAARADDTAAPVIVYTPPPSGSLPKAAFTVTAKITDESKFFPQVFFRQGSGKFEKALDMKKTKSGKDTYEATIPYKGDQLEFYIEAYDEFGNGPARAGDPEGPFKLTLGETAPPPPPQVVTKPTSGNNGGSTGPVAPGPSTKPGNGGAVASSSSGRTWTWVVGGVGLGLLTGGLVAGLAVKSADDAYKQALAGSGSSGGSSQVTNPSALQAQYDANASLGTKATILTISGAVLLAGGVALFFVEPMLNGDSASDSGAKNKSSTTKPGKPKHSDDDSGFSGENDTVPAAPLPAVSNLSVGAAPVQGGAAFALAGHF